MERNGVPCLLLGEVEEERVWVIGLAWLLCGRLSSSDKKMEEDHDEVL